MVEALKPRSALADILKPGRYGVAAETSGVTITEIRGRALVHIDFGSLESTAPAPDAISMGPGRWLIATDDKVLAERLAAEHTAAAVNYISSSRTCLQLSGPKARTVLASGCSMDLHASAFKSGDSATTLVGQFTVTLMATDDDTFEIFVARGFAQSFFEWLTGVAAEVGYEVS